MAGTLVFLAEFKIQTHLFALKPKSPWSYFANLVKVGSPLSKRRIQSYLRSLLGKPTSRGTTKQRVLHPVMEICLFSTVRQEKWPVIYGRALNGKSKSNTCWQISLQGETIKSDSVMVSAAT